MKTAPYVMMTDSELKLLLQWLKSEKQDKIKYVQDVLACIAGQWVNRLRLGLYIESLLRRLQSKQ